MKKLASLKGVFDNLKNSVSNSTTPTPTTASNNSDPSLASGFGVDHFSTNSNVNININKKTSGISPVCLINDELLPSRRAGDDEGGAVLQANLVDNLATDGNDICLEDTHNHGLPFKPTAFACDPVQKLIAVANREGEVKIYGKPGVQMRFSHPTSPSAVSNKAAVFQMMFVVNQGKLITCCTDDTLNLWDFSCSPGGGSTPPSGPIETVAFNKEHMTCATLDVQDSFVYIGTDKGNVFVVSVANFSVSGYQIAWNRAMDPMQKGHPGEVVQVAVCPQDASHLLIGFSCGLVTFWDLARRKGEQRFCYPSRLHSLAWHYEGKHFISAHHDGSLATWTVGPAGMNVGKGGGGGLTGIAATTSQATKALSIIKPHESRLISAKTVGRGGGGGGGSGDEDSDVTVATESQQGTDIFDPIDKVVWLVSRSSGETIIVFSGGLPLDEIGVSTPSITILQTKAQTLTSAASAAAPAPSFSSSAGASSNIGGSGGGNNNNNSYSTTLLEMEYAVVDFAMMTDSPFNSDVHEVEAIVALLQHDIVAIDCKPLASKQQPTSHLNPYAMDLDQSPVTCCQYVDKCNSELIHMLATSGSRSKAATFMSSRDWPVSGGSDDRECAARDESSSAGEILLTGHADGTIRIWDVTQNVMRHLVRVRSQRYLERNSVCDSDSLLTKKMSNQTSSTISDAVVDPLPSDPFAVVALDMCDRRLAVGGASGHMFVFDFVLRKGEAEWPKVMEIPVMYEVPSAARRNASADSGNSSSASAGPQVVGIEPAKLQAAAEVATSVVTTELLSKSVGHALPDQLLLSSSAPDKYQKVKQDADAEDEDNRSETEKRSPSSPSTQQQSPLTAKNENENNDDKSISTVGQQSAASAFVDPMEGFTFDRPQYEYYCPLTFKAGRKGNPASPSFLPRMLCLTPWVNGEAAPPIRCIAQSFELDLVAYGNLNGLVIVDVLQSVCLLNMGTPDLYGTADPFTRQPKSPRLLNPFVGAAEIVRVDLGNYSQLGGGGGGGGGSGGEKKSSDATAVEGESRNNVVGPSSPSHIGKACQKLNRLGSRLTNSSLSVDHVSGVDDNTAEQEAAVASASSTSSVDQKSFNANEEARRTLSSDSSVVCTESVTRIQFVATFPTGRTKLPHPCLTVGTSFGTLLTLTVNVPSGGGQRLTEPVVVLPNEHHVCTSFIKSDVMTSAVLDCSSQDGDQFDMENVLIVPKRQPVPSKSGALASDDEADRQILVLCTRHVASTVALPSHTLLHAHTIHRRDSSIHVVSSSVVLLNSTPVLFVHSSDGFVRAFSLPSFRSLLSVYYILPPTTTPALGLLFGLHSGSGLHCVDGSRVQKFTLSRPPPSVTTPRLFVDSIAMPDPPKPGFLRGIFSSTPKPFDRDELFGESASGRTPFNAVTHKTASSSSASSMSRLQNNAASASSSSSEIGRAHAAFIERGQKVSELEDKTEMMSNEAKQFASSASKLLQEAKNKKWYQL